MYSYIRRPDNVYSLHHTGVGYAYAFAFPFTPVDVLYDVHIRVYIKEPGDIAG